MSFSPDGTRIVTGSADETPKVWDARTGQELTGGQALHGDRLAQRLVAQELLRDGKPGPAIPRRALPPVAGCRRGVAAGASYLDLKQPDEAKRFYKAAVEWLDRPRDAKDNFGLGFAPNGDPRRNPFDWEAWHECDVFRAEVERRSALKP